MKRQKGRSLERDRKLIDKVTWKQTNRKTKRQTEKLRNRVLKKQTLIERKGRTSGRIRKRERETEAKDGERKTATTRN